MAKNIIRIDITGTGDIGKTKIAAVIADALRQRTGEDVEIEVRSADPNFEVWAGRGLSSIARGQIDADRIVINDINAEYIPVDPHQLIKVHSF